MEHGSTQKSGATTNEMKGVPTSDRCSVARESGEPSQMGTQKTASAGAPRDDATKWARVDWARARREVRRLQVRIAKAVTPWLHEQGTQAGLPNKGSLLECLSRMMGNYHVRF